MSTMIDGNHTRTAALSVAVVPCGPLRAMLTGAMAAAGDDRVLPVLCCVRVTTGHGAIRVEGTDRYRAVLAEYMVPEGFAVLAESEILVDRRQVSALLRALPKGKGTDVVPVTVTLATDRTAIFEWTGGSMTVDCAHGSFPHLRNVMPKNDEQLGLPGGSINLSGAYLATLGQIPTARNQPWTCTFHGADKPMVATCMVEGEPSWTFILMPVRIS